MMTHDFIVKHNFFPQLRHSCGAQSLSHVTHPPLQPLNRERPHVSETCIQVEVSNSLNIVIQTFCECNEVCTEIFNNGIFHFLKVNLN